MFDSIFEIFYVIGFVAGSVIRKLYVKQYKQNKITDDREAGPDKLLLIFVSVGFIGLPLLYLVTSWLDFADCGLGTWAGRLGTAVFACALWFLWRSHADLGRNWSAKLEIREDHSLVTEGAYKYVRHPMYSAHFLWAIAQMLLLQNWIAGPAFLVTFIPLYLFRVPLEERMMLEHFGEEYSSYMNHTGRVFPRFWR